MIAAHLSPESYVEGAQSVSSPRTRRGARLRADRHDPRQGLLRSQLRPRPDRHGPARQSRTAAEQGRAYRVESIDAEAGTVSLATPQGKAVAWSPRRWGSDRAEAFVEVEQELRTGDRIQFTRNNRRAVRLNGHTASVLGIDPRGVGIVVEREDGKQDTLDLTRLADRRIRLGWVRTIHSAQGATADRGMVHLESFRANTVDAPAVYVAISRVKDAVALYTDSRSSSPRRSAYATARRLAQSMRCGGRWRWRWDRAACTARCVP